MALPLIVRGLGSKKVATRFGDKKSGEIISDFILDETTKVVEETPKESNKEKWEKLKQESAELVDRVVNDVPEVVKEGNIEVEVPKKVDKKIDEKAKKTENALISKKLQKASELPKVATERLKALPIWGGIGLLLALILFIIFAIRPVEGADGEYMEDEDGRKVTRLKLIWRVLINRAELVDTPEDAADGGEPTTTEVAKEVASNITTDVMFKTPLGQNLQSVGYSIEALQKGLEVINQYSSKWGGQ